MKTIKLELPASPAMVGVLHALSTYAAEDEALYMDRRADECDGEDRLSFILLAQAYREFAAVVRAQTIKLDEVDHDGPKASSGPRAKTGDEVVAELMGCLRMSVLQWDGQDLGSRQKLEGLVHSILVLLDGMGDLPPFELTPTPSQEDRSYHEANGDNWYESAPINGGISLHERWRGL